MAQVAIGDADALAILYDRHAGRLLAVALRILGDRAVAEEVVQELFLYVWHRAEDYRPARASVTTWLILIARSRALDRVRRRRIVHRVRQEFGRQPRRGAAANEGYPAVLGGERERAVRGAMQELPGEQREVLECAYFDGLTQRQIAARLDIPLGTVKTRTTLGLKKLRRRLRGEVEALL